MIACQTGITRHKCYWLKKPKISYFDNPNWQAVKNVESGTVKSLQKSHIVIIIRFEDKKKVEILLQQVEAPAHVQRRNEALDLKALSPFTFSYF